MTKLHLIFDFDMTMTRFHTGGVYKQITHAELIEPTLQLEIIRTAFEENHFVSICTHGNSSQMISETLTILGLTPNETKKIPVVTGLKPYKNEHIKDACVQHGLLSADKKRLLVKYPIRTVLIDDDENNAMAAKEEGSIVLIPRHIETEEPVIDSSHLHCTREILRAPHQAEALANRHAEQRDYNYLFQGFERRI